MIRLVQTFFVVVLASGFMRDPTMPKNPFAMGILAVIIVHSVSWLMVKAADLVWLGNQPGAHAAHHASAQLGAAMRSGENIDTITILILS